MNTELENSNAGFQSSSHMSRPMHAGDPGDVLGNCAECALLQLNLQERLRASAAWPAFTDHDGEGDFKTNES
jgi:hypothetical protein